jgi:hypothetical protein
MVFTSLAAHCRHLPAPACAGDVELLAGKCGSNAAVAAAAIEATARTYATELIARLPNEPSGGTSSAVLACLPLRSIYALIQQQLLAPEPQQLLPEQRGLLVTCLKMTEAAALASWGLPLQVLQVAVELCKVLPGVKVAACKSLTVAATTALGMPVTLAVAAANACAEAAGNSSSSDVHGGGSGTASGSGSSVGSASSSTSSAAGNDAAFVLLLGRALHAAGHALLRMHEQQGIIAAPSVVSSSSRALSSHGGWNLDRFRCRLRLQYHCWAVLRPLSQHCSWLVGTYQALAAAAVAVAAATAAAAVK